MDKELIADEDSDEASSIISENFVADAAKDIGISDATLNQNFAPFAGEFGKTRHEFSLGLSPVIGELAKRHREVSLGLSPVIGELAKRHREVSLGLSPVIGELAKRHREVSLGLSPVIGELAKRHREVSLGLSPVIGELAKRHREMSLGLSPVIGELAKRHREMSLGLSPVIGELAKRHREMSLGLSPVIGELAKRHRAMSLSLSPAIGELAKRHRAMSLSLSPAIGELAKRHRAMSLSLSPVIGELARMRRVLGQNVTSIAHTFPAIRLGKVLEKHGWFPHYTMPEYLLADNQDNPELNEILTDYYRGNWNTVRQTIEQQLDTYLVDAEAKAAFRECLDAHENGLYRLVCRSSFPEVERIIRVEINHNNVGHFSVQKLVRQHFDDLPVSVFPNSKFGFTGYRQFTEHLYAQVKNDADRQHFSSHPIPNRHAAIHGLIQYSSEQSSLNSIFVAEYIFQLITAQKSFEKEAVLRT